MPGHRVEHGVQQEALGREVPVQKGPQVEPKVRLGQQESQSTFFLQYHKVSQLLRRLGCT